MSKKKRLVGILLALPPLLLGLLYGGGYIAQFMRNYHEWQAAGGTPGNGTSPTMPSFSMGGYFYYAHLSSYGRAFQKGDRVSAGDLLGYMGDSGYGPEGTTGRFDVHLHIGIYIEGENRKEISVNPYWPLRYLEESIDFS